MTNSGSMVQTLAMYIDGEWCEPASGEYFETFNPFDSKPWALVPRGRAADADRAVEAAQRAFKNPAWRGLHPSKRGLLLHRLGALFEQNAEHLARTEVRDNGRLLAEMTRQISYVANWFYYYAGLCDKIEGAVHPCEQEALSFTRP